MFFQGNKTAGNPIPGCFILGKTTFFLIRDEEHSGSLYKHFLGGSARIFKQKGIINGEEL